MQALEIDNCTTLNAASTYYVLNTSVVNSSFNICMNVTARNVTLDCQGNDVDGRFNIIPNAIGVYVNESSNFTLKNCRVLEWNTAGVSVYNANNTNISYNIVSASNSWQVSAYNVNNIKIHYNQINGLTGDTQNLYGRRGVNFDTLVAGGWANDKIHIYNNNFLNQTSGPGAGYELLFQDAGAKLDGLPKEVVVEHNNFSNPTGTNFAFIYFLTTGNYSNATIRFNNFNDSTKNIFYYEGSGGDSLDSLTFYNNTAVNEKGMFFFATSANFTNANISHNAVTQGYNYQILVLDYMGDGNNRGLVNSVIHDNTFSVDESAWDLIYTPGFNITYSRNVLSGAGGSCIHHTFGHAPVFYANNISNCGSEGIYIESTGDPRNYANVSHNFIHNVGDSCVYADASNSWIHHNTCFNTVFEGIWPASPATNNTITFNTGWNSTKSLGGSIDSSNVSYNLFFNNTLGGISGTQGTGITLNDNNILLNNTVFNCTGAGIDFTGASGNKLYYNNVSYNFINFYLNCRQIFGMCAEYSQNNEIVESLSQNNESGSYDFYLTALDSGSQVTLVNTTFNKTAVILNDAASNLTVKWYADVQLVFTNGNPVSNGRVNATNVNGILVFDVYTNSTGWITRQNVTEYWQNQTDVLNYTPHDINASYSLFPNSTNSTTQVFSEYHLLVLVLEIPPYISIELTNPVNLQPSLILQVILTLVFIIITLAVLFAGTDNHAFKLLFFFLAVFTSLLLVFTSFNPTEDSAVNITKYDAAWTPVGYEDWQNSYNMSASSRGMAIAFTSNYTTVIALLVFLAVILFLWEALEFLQRKKREKRQQIDLY